MARLIVFLHSSTGLLVILLMLFASDSRFSNLVAPKFGHLPYETLILECTRTSIALFCFAFGKAYTQ